MTSRAGRTGFTLIELLTVILIIGLLAAILLPAVLSVVQANWRAKCNNNLHVLGVSMTDYATRHNSSYPPWNKTVWKDWLVKQGIGSGTKADVLLCPGKHRGRVDSSGVWDTDPPASDYVFYPEGTTRCDITSDGKALPNDTVLAQDKNDNHLETIGSDDCLGWNRLYADGRVLWHRNND